MSQWYFHDGSVWLQLDSQLCNELEKCLDTGSAKVSFTNGCQYDIADMSERLPAGTVRAIRRESTRPNPKFLWEWDMDGYWQPFSSSDSELLSKVHESGISSTVLYIGGTVTKYIVDTVACQQLNTITRFRRRIRMTQNPTFTKTTASSAVSEVDLLINAAQTMADPDDDACAICLDPFDEEYGEALRLPLCDGHGFHKECIRGALQSSGKCPLCMKMYIIQEGTQPSSGTMASLILPPGKRPLEGYAGVGTIVIRYHFPNGIQESHHPHPGRPFRGTSREAYLPDIPEGREVLELLHLCFEYKSVFTVGTSVTTGVGDSVIWNGVHHKTSTGGGPTAYGYPDPTYLTRVKSELAAKGITPDML